MNEFLERMRFQSARFFSNLNNQQRFVLIGSAVGLLALAIVILAWTGSPPYTPLYTDLTPQDAADIVSKLKDAQVDYQISGGGRTIMVPDGQVYDLRLQFASDGLPGSGTVGYEIFDNQELGVTEFKQQIAYKRAIEGELSRTLRSIDYVQDASVFIVIPKERLFEKDQQQPSASVQLKLRGSSAPTGSMVQTIAHLVSSSIEGLEAEKVTITDTRGRILSQNRDPSSNLTMSATQLEFTRQVEQDLASKVQRLLEQRVGMGNSQVQVTAVLNWDQVEKTVHDVDPDRSATLSEELTEQSAQADNGSANGSKSSNTITNYENAKSIQRVVEEVGNIKQISVAVLINDATEVVVNGDGEETAQAIPRTDEEMQQLEQLAKRAVGFDPARSDQFSIVNMAFEPAVPVDDSFSLGLPWDMSDILESLLIVVTLAASIFVMKSMLSHAGKRNEELQGHIQQLIQAPPESLATARPASALQAAADIPDGAEGLSLEQEGPTLSDNLRQYAQTNPEVVSRLIKVWLMDDD